MNATADTLFTAQVGRKDDELFAQGVILELAMGRTLASLSAGERDGERRYGKALWVLASGWLTKEAVSRQYGHLKVWREGLEVAIKLKGSQGNRRVEWLKVEHPFTAISPACEVHANHNEALNSCREQAM